MSFEGYYQKMCKNGHAWSTDVYIDDNVCGKCEMPAIWLHMVDQTNDEGNPFKLRQKKIKSCEHCGSVLEVIYYKPKRRGK